MNLFANNCKHDWVLLSTAFITKYSYIHAHTVLNVPVRLISIL